MWRKKENSEPVQSLKFEADIVSQSKLPTAGEPCSTTRKRERKVKKEETLWKRQHTTVAKKFKSA